MGRCGAGGGTLPVQGGGWSATGGDEADSSRRLVSASVILSKSGGSNRIVKYPK
jgi:hypothetical protein